MSQDTTGSAATAAASTAQNGPPQHVEALENLLHQNRRFAPSAEFAANAVTPAGVYSEAAADRPAFWAKQARELLVWYKDFNEALDWPNPPFVKWFVGGETNAAYNALDWHVENGLGDRVAIYFEGEPGDTRTYTYAELTEEVKAAGGDALTVRTRVSAPDKRYGALVDYKWTSDGESIALQTQVRPDGDWVNQGAVVEWPRIGLEIVLAGETSTVSWFGQGPHQSYPDTGQGARKGWFSLPLKEMVVDYARPQESGARSRTRSASLEMNTETLTISSEPFALTVRPYSRKALEAATHSPDLKPDGKTYLYLDHALRGVGTAACGPGVLEQYRLTPREADSALLFRLLAGQRGDAN